MTIDEITENQLDLLYESAHAKFTYLKSKHIKPEKVILMYLAHHNTSLYPKTLSEMLFLTTSRIAVVLNNLEKDGYIARTKDPEDDRKTIISATPKGKEEGLRYEKKLYDITYQMFDKLGEKDAKEYIRIQKRIDEITLEQIKQGVFDNA